MDPILFAKPELVRFRTKGAYRAWEQGQRSSQAAVRRPRRIVYGLRSLITARRGSRSGRRVVLALDDSLSGS